MQNSTAIFVHNMVVELGFAFGQGGGIYAKNSEVYMHKTVVLVLN